MNEGKITELKGDLEHINRLIKRGEEFEALGYDSSAMNSINISIRNRIVKEISDLENSCPMTQEYCKENGLSDAAVKKFCKEGCSVDCKKQAQENLERKARK